MSAGSASEDWEALGEAVREVGHEIAQKVRPVAIWLLRRRGILYAVIALEVALILALEVSPWR